MSAPGLIVALDTPAFDQARQVLDALAGLPLMYKVGLEAFSAYGEEIRKELERREQPYFLDVKLNDIPNTVAGAIRALVRPCVRIIDVHALGGNEMMQA